jgi:hypothetical protein
MALKTRIVRLGNLPDIRVLSLYRSGDDRTRKPGRRSNRDE